MRIFKLERSKIGVGNLIALKPLPIKDCSFCSDNASPSPEEREIKNSSFNPIAYRARLLKLDTRNNFLALYFFGISIARPYTLNLSTINLSPLYLSKLLLFFCFRQTFCCCWRCEVCRSCFHRRLFYHRHL